MRARYRTPIDLQKLALRLRIEQAINYQANATVRPTDKGPILTMSSDGPRFELARFGFIPHWAKTIKGLTSLHNAKSETVKEKPAFRDAYKRGRCICIASGFVEWVLEEGRKVPYYFSRKDGEDLYIASIGSCLTIDNEAIPSFSTLTGEPTDFVKAYHNRMILITDEVEAWLDPANDPLPSFKAIAVDALKAERIEPERTASPQGALF
jgi:putative SOS response-associated peptidase YedK